MVVSDPPPLPVLTLFFKQDGSLSFSLTLLAHALLSLRAMRWPLQQTDRAALEAVIVCVVNRVMREANRGSEYWNTLSE